MSQFKVLLVDDENTVTYSISQLFKRKTQEVDLTVCNDPLEAISLLQQQDYNLLITDLMMPGFSGLDLITHVRRTHPEMQVMVITAFGSEQVREEIMKRGVIRYFEKPFEFEEFYEKVLEVLHLEDGFSGRMVDMELSDVIQMIGISGSSVQLDILHKNQVGKIYVRDGFIVHAQSKHQIGMEALVEMLSWDGGDFIPGPMDENIEQTILLDWNTALVAASTQRDHYLANPDPADSIEATKPERQDVDFIKLLADFEGVKQCQEIKDELYQKYINFIDTSLVFTKEAKIGDFISALNFSKQGHAHFILALESKLFKIELAKDADFNKLEIYLKKMLNK